MERIKKALELAREQREALERAKRDSSESAVAVVKQPEEPSTRSKRVTEPVVKQEPPVLTEVVERIKAETPVAEPPSGAPASERHAEPEQVATPPVAEPEQQPVSEKRMENEAGRYSASAIEAVESRPAQSAPEVRPAEKAVAVPEKRQKKERVAPIKSAVPSSIQYSQTRQVEVSAEKLESNRLIAGIKDHPQSDLFRVLRTKILHRMRVDGINSLAVTSPTKGAGKSMVAANLAVSLALEANQTVMLVDLDLRKPAISRYFGIEAQQGLADYLIDSAELPGLLVHPGIDRLVLLPAGNPVPQSSELLSTPRMSHLVEDITNRYASRIVLFDLPPLLHLDDALIFLPQVQSSILVVEEGVNSAAEVEQSLMLLEKSNLLGTVYNKARQTKHLPY